MRSPLRALSRYYFAAAGLCILLLLPTPCTSQVKWDPAFIHADVYGCSFDTSFTIRLINAGDTDIIGSIEPANGISVVDASGGWWINAPDTLHPGDTVSLSCYFTTIAVPRDLFKGSVFFSGVNISIGFELILVRHRPRLTFEPDTLALHDVPVGATVRDTIVVANYSSDAIMATQYSPPPAGWKVTGLQAGDVYPPGTQRNAIVEYTPTKEGKVTASLSLFDGCAWENLWLSATSHLIGLRWTANSYSHTVSDCASTTIHDLSFYNTDPTTPVILDSIGFLSNSTGWMVLDRGLFGSEISPRDTLRIRISGTPDNRQTNAVIYARGRIGDTISLSIKYNVPAPQITFPKDSSIIVLKPSETISNIAFDIKNYGNVDMRFISAEVIGDPRWSFNPIDTVLSLKPDRTITLTAAFAGADLPGDYRATFRLHSTPCDLPLSSTITARVQETNVVREVVSDEPFLRLYPLPASSILNVESAQASQLTILDLLGREMVCVHSHSTIAELDVRALPVGNYVLVASKEGRVGSQMITIER